METCSQDLVGDGGSARVVGANARLQNTRSDDKIQGAAAFLPRRLLIS